MSTFNIFLDFDQTVAKGHSGGFPDKDTNDPMSEENKIAFKSNLVTWLSNGHNVAIITRGVDTYVEKYFHEALELNPVMKGFVKGQLSIYAPDESTFINEEMDDESWANEKIKYVKDIISKIGGDPEGESSIFMDDTGINVREMIKAFPKMKCIQAKKGKYSETFNTVNAEIKSSNGGGRTKKMRKFGKKRKSRRNFRRRAVYGNSRVNI